jgi:hypothetical protein
MDWIVVSDRKRLRERFRPRNVGFRVEHRRAPPIDAREQLQLSLRTHRRV